MNDKKTATVVVTYNRKELLLKNLKQQFIQDCPISYIFIIDNCSTDGTYDYLSENGVFKDSRVKFIQLPENMGGAGGFERGVNEAFATDADYVILMDDDGYPINENTFSNLLKHIPDDNPLVMLNSLDICEDEHLSFSLGKYLMTKTDCEKEQKNGVILNLITPFNGTLVSRALYEKIGAPYGQFFIRGDEVEYRARAFAAKAYVATVVDSLYFHPAPVKREVKTFLGIRFLNTYDLPWKDYYNIRNTTFTIRKSSKLKAYLKFKKYMFGMMFFDIKDKKTLKKFVKLGYKDGKKGRLGKTIMPGQNTLKV